MDDGSISKGFIEYTTIKDISQFKESWIVNIVGVVSGVGEVTSLRLWNGETKKKWTITVADNSELPNGLSIDICFWGPDATDWEYSEGQIISFLNLRIADYNGRTLNSSNDSKIELNPNLPKAKEI